MIKPPRDRTDAAALRAGVAGPGALNIPASRRSTRRHDDAVTACSPSRHGARPRQDARPARAEEGSTTVRGSTSWRASATRSSMPPEGVIHRDLKPANILVDEAASRNPRLRSRAGDGHGDQLTLLTDMGQILGTLPYMSPEQSAATPRTRHAQRRLRLGDLYQLLAGRLPYDVQKKQLVEGIRIIREEDPAAQRVHRTFRGDVETIAAKALEKEKTAATSPPGSRGRHPPLPAGRADRGPAAEHRLPAPQVRAPHGRSSAARAAFAILVAGVVVSSWLAVRRRAPSGGPPPSRRRQAVNAFLNDDLLAAAAPSQCGDRKRRDDARGARRRGRAHREARRRAGDSRTSRSSKPRSASLWVKPTWRSGVRRAEPHLRRALALRREALARNIRGRRRDEPPGGPQLAQGRLDEAEPSIARLSRSATASSAGPPETMAYEMHLATSIGRRALPERAALRAQPRGQTASPRRRAPGHLDTMGNLANHYQETGRYEKRKLSIARPSRRGARPGREAPSTSRR